MDGSPLVKIVHDPTKGRILVAARDLLAGQSIIRERPLIVAMNHFMGMQRYEAGPSLVIPVW